MSECTTGKRFICILGAKLLSLYCQFEVANLGDSQVINKCLTILHTWIYKISHACSRVRREHQFVTANVACAHMWATSDTEHG